MHGSGAFGGPTLAGIPIEFILFALVLGVVAFAQVSTLATALGGALAITAYKLAFSPYAGGLPGHLGSEWVGMANLLALLLGFALLARHFESSQLPARLPDFLPDGWTGPLMLLVVIFIMSSFLDNIAAAMIGGAIAHTVFRGKVQVGYLAAIVAASNAGGCGSVVGDTTTTMMWLAGVRPSRVFHGYVAGVVALFVCAVPAALAQHKYNPMMKDAPVDCRIDWMRVAIVGIILGAAIAANVVLNLRFREAGQQFPFLGLAVWAAIVATAGLRKPEWQELPGAFKGAVFLLSLVWAASSMPVEALPAASWPNALTLGFVSAVFDNIPLTALALKQGGYDWGFLAYAVGFGGSMMWFGSSAGVALSNIYPEARSVVQWVREGWHVIAAYVVGFLAMLVLLGWHPAAAAGIMLAHSL